MNFFEHQAQARRNTRKLVFLFVIALILIIALLDGVVMLLFFSSQIALRPEGALPTLLIVSSILMAIVLGASFWKWHQLKRQGGALIAESLGGRRLDAASREPEERKLLNVVEEMAIAAGIPVPQIYILEEEGINAFAAGFDSSDVVIGVTRECLRQLNRDELQGIIAHEFSHIFHGDMLLNMRMLGALHGIFVFYIAGKMMLRPTKRYGHPKSSRDKSAPFALALILVGVIGLFLGRLIQAAISRQREYLADASAVQYTRNPQGILGALRKIGGWHFAGQIKDPQSSEMGHFLLVPAVKKKMRGLFATHPPLEKRIKAIDSSMEVSKRLGPSGVGEIDSVHIGSAEKLLQRFSGSLRDACRVPELASEAVLSIFLATDKKNLEQKENSLRGLESIRERRIKSFSDEMTSLGSESRLAVLELSLNSLRELPEESKKLLLEECIRISKSDGKIELHEFSLLRLLSTQLFPHRKPTGGRHLTADEARQILFSALAKAGTDSDREAEQAYSSSQSLLGGSPRPFLSESPDLENLNDAIHFFNGRAWSEKDQLLKALIHCVTHNGKLSSMEMELLRAVTDTLHMPLPLQWSGLERKAEA
jgi:Zn-dependent protease with chaperone function/uncharacterized tellurite resistance protein B-like protein